MPGVRQALHDLRAGRNVDAAGGQVQRLSHQLRPQQDAHRLHACAAQAAGAGGTGRGSDESRRATHPVAGRARSEEPRRGRDGHARTEEDG